MLDTKKRRKTMTYNKPELVTLASPIKAIQGVDKDLIQNFDVVSPHPFNATTGAYQSDE
jgi:hypothetical protein